MTDVLEHDLRPRGAPEWRRALQLLQASDDIRIAHIDSGVFPHPSLGYAGAAPPPNLRIAEGGNTYDPARTGGLPTTDLTRSGAFLDDLIEYPDHGVKTLSIILGADDNLRGVAPGATVTPWRVSNGPLFRQAADLRGGPFANTRDRPTATLAAGLRAALDAPVPPRVISVSMGNPGALGPFAFLVAAAGGEAGMDPAVRRQLVRAWRLGVIVCCAAGQVVDKMVYPARWREAIAVGGYARRGALFRRYPLEPYDLTDRVDVHALAVGINRASGRRVGGAIVAEHAATDPEAGEPSGTSYAAPQVAATAALWTARWQGRLDGPAFAGANAWRRVEAFRALLRGLPETVAETRENGAEARARLRLLDIERVIATPPDPLVPRPFP